MSKSWIKTLGQACLALIAFGSLSVAAHPAVSYPAFVPAEHPDYVHALELGDSGSSDQAAHIFQQLAAQNPRTTLGAMSLIKEAHYTATAEGKLAIWSSITAGYPGSRFDLFAKQYRLDLLYAFNDNARLLRETDQLTQTFGAPSLAEILRNPDPWRQAAQVRALSPEVQSGLTTSYLTLRGVLEGSKRYRDAMTLSVFCREAFPGEITVNQLGNILYNLNLLEPGREKLYQLVTIDPIVHLLSPTPTDVKGPRPKFQAEAWVGDYTHNPIALNHLQFTLDGRDVTPWMTVRSIIDASLRPGTILNAWPFLSDCLRLYPQALTPSLS